MVTLALMFLPELLLMSGGPAVAPPTSQTEQIDLKLDGMGCEACQMHVQRVLEGASGVVGATVSFESGQASVVVAKDWGFDLNATAHQLANDGYEVLSAQPAGAAGSRSAGAAALGGARAGTSEL